jgi:hypothetical protein
VLLLRAQLRQSPAAGAGVLRLHAQPDQPLNYGVMYLGLAAFLAMMSYSIHDMIGAAG